MNEKHIENDKLEQIIRRAHPTEPSPLLKERITAEARKAWNQTSLEMPWQIPVWRLAASAAAAMLIISITNLSSDLTLKRWHTRDIRSIQKQLPKPEVLTEMPVRPFVRNLVSVNRRPSMTDGSTLRNYTERVRHVLNETQRNGDSNDQVTDGGRSRLFEAQPLSDSYS